MPDFIEAGAPTDEQVHALLQIIMSGLMMMPARRGVLVEDMGQTGPAGPDTDGAEAHTMPVRGGSAGCTRSSGHNCGTRLKRVAW